MKAWFAAAAIVALALWWTPLARAQGNVSQMSETGYAASGSAADSGEIAVPMPDSDPGGDGSVVTVPIPGGGSVRVEGPDTVIENPRYTPLNLWGENANTPNSIVGTGPLGFSQAPQ